MDYEVIVLYITTLIVSFVNGDKAFPFTLFGLHVLDSCSNGHVFVCM